MISLSGREYKKVRRRRCSALASNVSENPPLVINFTDIYSKVTRVEVAFLKRILSSEFGGGGDEIKVSYKFLKYF